MTAYISELKSDRSMKQRQNKRNKCYCGCFGRATHIGLGQGAAMISGCELTVRRWVRDGIKASSVKKVNK
jgi:hypothetical protein